MSEPSSATAGGLAAWKLGVGFLGIGVVASALGFLVLLPRTAREAALRALATMIASALFGPVCVFAAYSRWPELFVAGARVMASLGQPAEVGFMAASAPFLAIGGLPAWWLLGALARWFDHRRDKDIVELVVDARADMRKVVS